MKYVIVIPDGCADEPVAELGNLTPLQAARLPNCDRVVQQGVVGLTNNVPRPLTPASDVATLSLFGYDPLTVYTGRAPLEAAALGVKLGPDDWAIRCNLVHVDKEEMRDFTAGHITSDDGGALMQAMQANLGGGKLEFHAGVSYRNILIHRGPGAPFSALVTVRNGGSVDAGPFAVSVVAAAFFAMSRNNARCCGVGNLPRFGSGPDPG